jgi:hypothetical protein
MVNGGFAGLAPWREAKIEDEDDDEDEAVARRAVTKKDTKRRCARRG